MTEYPDAGGTEVSRVRLSHTIQVKQYTSMTFDATVDVPNYADADHEHIIEVVLDKMHLAYGRVFLHWCKRYEKLKSEDKVKEWLKHAVPEAIRLNVLNDPILMDALLVEAKVELDEQEKEQEKSKRFHDEKS